VFALTHLYFAERLLGELEPAQALGAVFPDTGLAGGLSWEETHTVGERLYDRSVSLLPRDEPGIPARFARAVITHGAIPEGLDHYSDRAYRGGDHGYCFELSRDIADEAADICGLPRSAGWWKAHNFIEMAADLIVHERRPDLGPMLQLALTDRALLGTLASFLSDSLAATIEADRLENAFMEFPDYVQLDQVTPGTLAQKYEVQVEAKHGVQSIDVDAAESLIERCVPRVASTLDEFIALSLELVGPLLVGRYTSTG